MLLIECFHSLLREPRAWQPFPQESKSLQPSGLTVNLWYPAKESVTTDLTYTQTQSNEISKELFRSWICSNLFSFGSEYFQALFLQELWCCWHRLAEPAGMHLLRRWVSLSCLSPAPPAACLVSQAQRVPSLCPQPFESLRADPTAVGREMRNQTWPFHALSVQVLFTFPILRFTGIFKWLTDECENNSCIV